MQIMCDLRFRLFCLAVLVCNSLFGAVTWGWVKRIVVSFTPGVLLSQASLSGSSTL